MKTPLWPRYTIELVVGLCVLAADQISKAAVTALVAPHQVVEVIPGLFNLVNTRNRGAAFGFLNSPNMAWSFWLFLGATIVAIAVMLHMTRRAQSKAALFVAFGAIMGGALGNLVDRIRLGAVVDFLDVYVGVWHWPAFNVADSAICVGAVLAFILLWRQAPVKRSDNV